MRGQMVRPMMRGRGVLRRPGPRPTAPPPPQQQQQKPPVKRQQQQQQQPQQQHSAGHRPNLREIGQKLGLAVSITSVNNESSAGVKRQHDEAASDQRDNIKEEPVDVADDVEANVDKEDVDPEGEFSEDYVEDSADVFDDDYDSTAADISNMGEDYVDTNESFACYDDYGDDNNEDGATSKK